MNGDGGSTLNLAMRVRGWLAGCLPYCYNCIFKKKKIQTSATLPENNDQSHER
jgi:hypothetical protein